MTNFPPQEIETLIWNKSYRFKRPDGTSDENSIEDTNRRVVEAVFALDKGEEAERTKLNILDAMNNRELVPAGRQHAGAGTQRNVTLINCFISPTIEDSMTTTMEKPDSAGIMDALKIAAFTQQMGGGIGMDFSTLRPKGALVKGVGVPSSGPLHFMDMWDAMCQTIRSAGHRRGAMMATLSIDHPDVLDFIVAKQTPGRFTNFNVSVTVTDGFMEALRNNEDWDLGFNVPRCDDDHVEVLSDNDGDKWWYVYKRLPARELWDLIIKSTYDYAEPGVMFIDRINFRNNLWYCEDIRASNPCGEQVMPPNASCDLGAINLAKLVIHPFTNKARVDFSRLGTLTRWMTRYLDNVLDVTIYPTKEQKLESANKRRIGLGITGLANMLQQLGIRYGSNDAVTITRKVMNIIRDEAYYESTHLSAEKGSFPLLNVQKYLASDFVSRLPEDVKDRIRAVGIRNGVLLTVAPTGTTSIYYGNVSSGLEPTFAWSYSRKIRQDDGTFKEYHNIEDYGYRLYKHHHPDYKDGDPLPDYMVTTQELTVDEHLRMQAACQEFIDASVSKTINCPPDMSFEDFKEVYTKAYEMGCKGCTTYRPSPVTEKVRGSILSTGEKKDSDITVTNHKDNPLERPQELSGSTYKIKWPQSEHAIYVIINNYKLEDGSLIPFEVFINTKDARHQDWITALTLMISAVFRRGGNVAFVAEELKSVYSSVTGAWIEGKYFSSLVALIGMVIEKHFIKIGMLPAPKTGSTTDISNFISENQDIVLGDICPSCQAPTLVKESGCKVCKSCTYTLCD